MAAHPDIEPASERVDDGYSGVLFEREAFQWMLAYVEAGKINCIMVKDLSRLGRNTIDTGYYIEMVFPLYDVRFVSINDDFDSDKLHGDTGGINVAFKYLVSEFYSRDLSIKYKSAKYVKFRRGEYQSKTCSYGYRKGANGRMEPNEETAPNVQMIFELARDGCNQRRSSRPSLHGISPPLPSTKRPTATICHDIFRLLRDMAYVLGGAYSGR